MSLLGSGIGDHVWQKGESQMGQKVWDFAGKALKQLASQPPSPERCESSLHRPPPSPLLGTATAKYGFSYHTT